MSGSDRILVVARKRRGVLAGKCQRPEFPEVGRRVVKQVDRNMTRDRAMSQALAVKALGGVAVREAERLRAKGWSVKGIARQLGQPAGVIAALLGVGVA